ncbi:hypothetical protein DM02DRAFT_438170 [Periconia macrospinosa]|uniref:Uncharacterized protein n=1 Tax=Periconia macrospinosa TaxID=97972 RepID=A0A2V1DM22_9PLEO|nr:hypothetical protein DM02DRAFT_438170 [Periconia macrospinosa]
MTIKYAWLVAWVILLMGDCVLLPYNTACLEQAQRISIRNSQYSYIERNEETGI